MTVSMTQPLSRRKDNAQGVRGRDGASFSFPLKAREPNKLSRRRAVDGYFGLV